MSSAESLYNQFAFSIQTLDHGPCFAVVDSSQVQHTVLCLAISAGQKAKYIQKSEFTEKDTGTSW
jgi:hypothetical protein